VVSEIAADRIEIEDRRLAEGCQRGDFDCFERLMARY